MSDLSDFNPGTIRSLRRNSSSKLAESLSLSPELSQLEADILLVEAHKRQGSTNFSRVQIFSNLDELVGGDIALEYEKLVSLRLEGRPIAYILGVQEFYGYQFLVSERTLIPRPETELLVESLLSLSSPYIDPVLLDIGTGSGAIIISTLLERMKVADCSRMLAIASDISMDALNVARNNSQRHKLDTSVKFFQASMLSSFNLAPLSRCPLFIASNPPYIDIQDSSTCEFVRKYEPASALFSPEEGLYHSKNLIREYLSICNYWQNDLYLLIEVGLDQAIKLKSFAESLGIALSDNSCSELEIQPGQVRLSVLRDLAAIERILVFSCKL